MTYCIKYMFVLSRNGKLKESWIQQEFQKDLWEEKKQSKQFGVLKEFQIPTKLATKCKPSQIGNFVFQEKNQNLVWKRIEVLIFKSSFKPCTKEERSHILLENQSLVSKKIEVSSFKSHFEPWAEDEWNYFEPRAKEERNYFEPHAEEKRNDFKPCTEEDRSISCQENSSLMQKRSEVTFYQKIQTSYEKG